jgi:hypothetical protein
VSTRYLPVAAALLLAALVGACTDGEEAAATAAPSSPAATATSAPKATATPTQPPTAATTPKVAATPTAAPGTLAAPRNVRLSGPLPDPRATVPPGQGELGRVTVLWDPVPGAAGYMLYPKDCDGTVGRPIDLAPTTSFGPVQPCRPGGDVGVASIAPGGAISTVTWANPQPRRAPPPAAVRYDRGEIRNTRGA